MKTIVDSLDWKYFNEEYKRDEFIRKSKPTGYISIDSDNYVIGYSNRKIENNSYSLSQVLSKT